MSTIAAPKSIDMPAAIAKNEAMEEKSRMVVGGSEVQYRTDWTLQRSCHFPLQGQPCLKRPARTVPPSKLSTILYPALQLAPWQP